MKSLLVLFILAVAVYGTDGSMQCNAPLPEVDTTWIDLKGGCKDALTAQIQREVNACFTYLSMGAYFYRDKINRPAIGDFFFNAAREERQHAFGLVEYMSMRGLLYDNVTDLMHVPHVEEHDWGKGHQAFEEALKLETSVTQEIRNVIKACEEPTNYYHLVDHLTGEYLTEQLKGQRDLAGRVSTLRQMLNNYDLAEFLYDKEL